MEMRVSLVIAVAAATFSAPCAAQTGNDPWH